MTQKLHIIDTLGPFFINKPDRREINWSKVIFSDLETNNRLTQTTQEHIIKRFQAYVARVSKLGYNAISIDDLAHLVDFSFYSSDLQALLGDYRMLYRQLFNIAKSHNMKIFVNTDYLFFNEAIHTYSESNSIAPDDFYIHALKKAIEDFPEIDGVILRVGEKDGNDVSGTFLSQLLLHTPLQANQLLKKILPLFEQTNKTLVFRTWTIGAYKIGDLIWNKKTYNTIFSSIHSNALVISMKYGDTDFMRYLTLNPLFLNGPHKKIIELQTRREWEGMGTYPSFVGWDYAEYLKKLSKNTTIIGTHVWCQTGGWAKKEWSNLTYLENSSFWNELNTCVTIRMAHDHQSVEEAIKEFCKSKSISDHVKFTELLRQSDTAIKKGIYASELAKKEFYFRRSRIPPLMWLTWDRVHLPSAVVHLHRILLSSRDAFVKEGDAAIRAAEKMIILAEELRLSKEVTNSLQFEHATLTIFAQLRRYIATSLSPEDLAKLNKQIAEYELKYPQHYSIPKLFSVQRRRIPRSLLSPFLRESAAYRKRDRIFLKTSPIQARMIRYYLKKSHSHLANQSMGLETLFK
jgi:DNA-binding Lrp family transcriptional regulator